MDPPMVVEEVEIFHSFPFQILSRSLPDDVQRGEEMHTSSQIVLYISCLINFIYFEFPLFIGLYVEHLLTGTGEVSLYMEIKLDMFGGHTSNSKICLLHFKV
jgi:hypothetical protein